MIILLQNSMRIEKGFFFFCRNAKARFLLQAFALLVISSSLCVRFIWSPVVLSLNWSALTPNHDSCFRKGHRNYVPEVSWQNSANLTAPTLLFLYMRTGLDFRITWRINTKIWEWGTMPWHCRCCFALQLMGLCLWVDVLHAKQHYLNISCLKTCSGFSWCKL